MIFKVYVVLTFQFHKYPPYFCYRGSKYKSKVDATNPRLMEIVLLLLEIIRIRSDYLLDPLSLQRSFICILLIGNKTWNKVLRKLLLQRQASLKIMF